MSKFKKYRRKQVAELRPVTDEDILNFETFGRIATDGKSNVSISDEDKREGKPEKGDMIARNPKNHDDQWLVAEEYFNDNFEPYT